MINTQKPRFIGQKAVPNIIIDGIELNTLTDFSFFSKNGKNEVSLLMSIIPANLKGKLIEGTIIGSRFVILEETRDLNGNDFVTKTEAIIRDYEFEYSLNAEEEPCEYVLILRDYEDV
jgi:hypothetical protein